MQCFPQSQYHWPWNWQDLLLGINLFLLSFVNYYGQWCQWWQCWRPGNLWQLTRLWFWFQIPFIMASSWISMTMKPVHPILSFHFMKIAPSLSSPPPKTNRYYFVILPLTQVSYVFDGWCSAHRDYSNLSEWRQEHLNAITFRINTTHFRWTWFC